MVLSIVNNFINNLDNEYENLINDVIKFGLFFLVAHLLSDNLSKNNPLKNTDNLVELFQVVVLFLLSYHLIVRKFILVKEDN